ncbi:MAG TPA: hypothetical protein VKM37_01130 [Balneolaceae bacterium]|nr:hypothetical protein [Balneolaceae bacterium]
MALRHLTAFVFLIFIISSCSSDDAANSNKPYIEGRITVNDSLDSTGDYSGIQILSSVRSGAESIDTLFYAVTDSTGSFSGFADIDENGIYPVLLSRNSNNFGLLNVVLAEGDSVSITAELPDVRNTSEITSDEQEVLRTLERVERGFRRVANFMNAGAISADSIQIEIEKWSDIYWQVFEENRGKHVARLSGESSATILQGWNDSLMVERANIVLDEYSRISPNLRNLLIQHISDTEGLSATLGFIDELEEKTPTENDKISIQIKRIDLLYDSSRTERATEYLNQLKNEFPEDEFVQSWAENMAYDLEYLAPGSSFPELQFQLVNGDSVSTSSLKGQPFLLEVTRLDNALYQEQYDRTVAIYQIYRNFDLEIITVPVSVSDVMFSAFFEERSRIWPFVRPNSFDTEALVEVLNLNRVPTRFLIDADGTIIGRYIGTEYDNILDGLQRITTITE